MVESGLSPSIGIAGGYALMGGLKAIVGDTVNPQLMEEIVALIVQARSAGR